MPLRGLAMWTDAAAWEREGEKGKERREGVQKGKEEKAPGGAFFFHGNAVPAGGEGKKKSEKGGGSRSQTERCAFSIFVDVLHADVAPPVV